MTYRFKLREPIDDGVRRIGLEQIDIAAAKLASKDDIPASIHDARRCLKRLRALLRLIRPALAETVYRREAERLLGTGRLLAGARDHFVMQQTLTRLEARFGPLPEGAADRLRQSLAKGQADRRRIGDDGRRQALTRLEQAKRLFMGRAANGIGLEHVVEGLVTTYRNARKTFRHAYKEPSDESFHAWRKKVQQHWRHMSLLSRGWPEAMSARAGEAKELSRLLGEDHDLAVLHAFGGDPTAAILEPSHLEVLSQLCRSCQAELRAQARPRGERLFAERAGALGERVALYWDSAGCLAALASVEDPSAQDGAPGRRLSVAAATAASSKRPTRPRYRRR